MKKSLIIILIILLIIIAIIGVIFVFLNKEKTSISADTFNNIMEAKGYTVIDATSSFTQYENYLSKCYVAKVDAYQIEFFELSNEENAIDTYNTNKTKVELQKTNNAVSTTKSLKNYSTYSLSSNEKYTYLSRIDNTFIYIDVDKSYKNIVKDIMKEIGY